MSPPRRRSRWTCLPSASLSARNALSLRAMRSLRGSGFSLTAVTLGRPGGLQALAQRLHQVRDGAGRLGLLGQPDLAALALLGDELLDALAVAVLVGARV